MNYKTVIFTFVFGAILVFALDIMWPMAASYNPLETPVSNDQPEPRLDRLPPSGIGGHVRLPSGQPLQGVVVLPRSLDEPPASPIPDIANTTDEAGHYFWDLPTGRYRLTFVLNGKTIAIREVTIRDNQRAVTLDIIASDRGNP
jgi:hypothetical protein